MALGGALGCLVARFPTFYTLSWWLGTSLATYLACQVVRRALLVFPVALLVNLSGALLFWWQGGVPALILSLYHTTHLSGGALRGLLSDLLSTAVLACFASLIVALVVRNGRLVEGRA